jgi:hypothetical protein
MKRIRRATVALPLAVVLAGILVPVLMDRALVEAPQVAERAQSEIRGKTGAQWADAAREAQDQGDFRRALYCIKTAERVDPGTQYAQDLSVIRRARWRRQQVVAARERLMNGPLEDLTFQADGSLASGRRSVIALPGESLWSLARALVAAERGVLPGDVGDRGDVYRRWDELVELNGLRELEVGERVGFPLSSADVAAIESENRADLDSIAAATVALDAGDLAGAERLLGGVAGVFARGTEVYRQADEAVALARELRMVEGARAAIDQASGLSRATNHDERLTLFTNALEAILEAENMRSGTQYADARDLAERMSNEERRYEVREDGSVVAVKPSGESYTAVARDAVEWLLQRELEASGSTYPNSHLKSEDDRAWARYLMLARERAESEGTDFAGLLASEGEVVLHLPEPASVFAD